MEEDDVNHHQGGGGAAGGRIFFFRGAGGAALRIRNLGGHPPHGMDLGGVSGPGEKTDDGEDPAEETGREVDVHLGSDGKGGGGVTEDGGIHLAVPEHGSIVPCYTITVGPV